MSTKAVLTGDLAFICLADVFQILGGNHCTGSLRISSPYSPYPGTVYLKNGTPVKTVCGSTQGLKSLYSMFGWETGEFAFYEEDVNLKNSIGRSRMEIVLDAMRMLDDGLIQKVGPRSPNYTKDQWKYSSKDKDKSQIIKGPFLDFSYVIKEDLYSSGDIIVKEKSHGKWLWVVHEGVVRIERETPWGPVTLARLGPGSFIGTFKALLFGEYTRSATVRAENDVRLCLLDSENLHKEYVSLSYFFRILLLSLDDRLRKTNDKAISLQGGEKEKPIPPSTIKTIINKGTSLQDLYKIEAGQAHLVSQYGSALDPLLTLEKDDIFGFIPFLDIGHEPRAVAVVGNKELRLQQLDPKSLLGEYERLTPTFQNLIRHLGTCIHMTTDLLFHHKNISS